MVPFAGWEMPVQYPSGILAEHLHCRQAAALFDVSHMGQVRLAGPEAAGALRAAGARQHPGAEARPGALHPVHRPTTGGILDDLIVSNAGDHLFVVVNAGGREADLAHLRAGLEPELEVRELADRALLALQGPAAAAVMAGLAPQAAGPVVHDHGRDERRRRALPRVAARLHGRGRVRDLGRRPSARSSWRALLLGAEEVTPAGLGARDSLRLEAGLCLYGHDIDTTTTPVEAQLGWTIAKRRRESGGLPGGRA